MRTQSVRPFVQVFVMEGRDREELEGRKYLNESHVSQVDQIAFKNK